MSLTEYVRDLYGDVEVAPCPFTEKEIAELDKTDEILVYLPKRLKPKELCEMWGIPANVDWDAEKMIRSIMVAEDQWFITSGSKTPELIFKSGQYAQRLYEDQGLHGLDMRRYLAFCATFRRIHGEWPDQAYWSFLTSGSYDRSGISIVGFDKHGVLNHHGWMRNFKSKFCGSRYCVIAPRIEITPDTFDLPRARRGERAREGLEADMD